MFNLISTTIVGLTRVRVAGMDADCDAHIDVSQHGFACFRAPDAACPLPDIDGSPEQLRDLVVRLQAALVSHR